MHTSNDSAKWPTRIPRPALLPAALTLGLLAMLPTPAGADALDAAEVQRHLTRAGVFLEQGDCIGAVREFEIIDGWFRTHGDLIAFRWNYAECLARTDRPLDALESFEMVRALDVPPETREAAAAQIERLRRTRLGRLAIACEPADAGISIAGSTDAPVPCPLAERDAPVGPLEIVVATAEGIEWRRTIQIEAGRTTRLEARLPTVLRIESPVPGAIVQVDGRRRGEAGPGNPVIVKGLRPSGHTIRVSPPDGGPPWQGTVRLFAGRQVRANANLEVPMPDEVEPGRRPAKAGGDKGPDGSGDEDDVVFWVGVGVGAAGLVAGGLALLLTMDEPARTRPRAEVPVLAELP